MKGTKFPSYLFLDETFRLRWPGRAKPARFNRLVLICVLVAFGVCTGLATQSGRRKEPSKRSPPPVKESPGPIAEPATIGKTKSTLPEEKGESGTESDEVDSNDVLRISSSLVAIPATVIDLKGLALTSLLLEDFELRVDGQQRTLSNIARSESVVHMAMLFDNSGSLDFAREFEKHAAMRFFSRVLRPNDEAAIYSVETDSYLAQPLTNDIHKLMQTIEGFGTPKGATSLFDAIIDANSYLKPYQGRRVIVIVSDGIETASRADFETVIHRLLGGDCQVFIVQTGLYDGVNLRALAAERRMEEIAAQTGGAAYIPHSTAELDTAFNQIAADLAQQYILSYYPQGEPRDGKFHAIDLRIKGRNDVRIRSRKGYYSSKSDKL